MHLDMKQFELDEYLKNPNRKVVTRGGESVRIMCTDCYGEKPIIAKTEEGEYSYPFYEDGKFLSYGEPSHLDLFFAPEKKVGWVNVYKNMYGAYVLGELFIGKEHEEVTTSLTYIATSKIEWEE